MRLAQITQAPYFAHPQLNSYDPDNWRPELFNLQSTWLLNTPDLSVENTPSAVFAWLPGPLSEPEDAFVTLEVIQAILDLPSRAGQSWADAAFDLALPTEPDVPQLTSSEWLANWFTDDTLGISDVLSDRYPDLTATNLPSYGIGNTIGWVEPE